MRVGSAVLGFLLAAAPMLVYPAEWVRLQDSENFVSYYDRTSLRKLGEIATMVLLFDYKSPQSDSGARFNSTTTKFEFDCQVARARGRSLVLHSGAIGSGQTVTAQNYVGQWNALAVESFNEEAREIACGVGK